MERKFPLFLVVAVALLGVSVPVFAHHGSSASYDLAKRVTMKGTVTEFVWQNPHAQLYWDTKDDKGNVTHWGGEMNSPGILARGGWTKNTVKPGDEITITVAPARAGTPVGLVGNVVLPDGKTLLGDGVLRQGGPPQE